MSPPRRIRLTTFYDTGKFTIRLQVSGPGGTDYASWTINVWETPNVAFNSAPDSVFVKDKPVTLLQPECRGYQLFLGLWGLL